MNRRLLALALLVVAVAAAGCGGYESLPGCSDHILDRGNTAKFIDSRGHVVVIACVPSNGTYTWKTVYREAP